MSRKNIQSFLVLTLTGSILAACSTVQAPAPIEQGAIQGAPADAYGIPPQTSAPYVPPSAQQAYAAQNQQYSQPYASSPTQQQNYGAPLSPVSSGSYVPSYAPVDVRAQTHTVIYGDTVYNIAKRYGINQNDLRAWNHLPDNNIRIGQVLQVKPSGAIGQQATLPTTAYTPQQPQVVTQATPQVVTPVVPPAVQQTAPVVTAPQAVVLAKDTSGINWLKPSKGQILTTFGGSSKGVDYGGQRGDPIYAAAGGKVVYSGSGLRGYGNLLIIQHSSRYLTAYGNNQKLLVKEGQTVKRGQKIAQMGSSDAPRVQLHFEVREDGKPVDPARFIK